jgi:hypothetical protein
MPNPRNRLKLTGDTHLPDLDDDGGAAEEDTLRFEPVQEFRRGQDGEPSVAVRVLPESGHAYFDAAREQVRQRPVAVLAGAFVLGWLLARI